MRTRLRGSSSRSKHTATDMVGGCVCAPTEAKVNALNDRGMSSSSAFVGTPAQVIEQMQAFIDLGVDYFMLSAGGFPDFTTLETLLHEVLPVLNRTSK